jgi:hypothetical protein
MQRSSNSGQSDDTSKVSDHITKLVMKDPLHRPILAPELIQKHDRGFNHPRTAELICPAKYLEQYRRDPTV